MRMKRIAIGLMSLAVIGVYAQPSWAWLFHGCCGCKYTTYICCRPYNAFTPVCFGNITGLGCCPVAMNCCDGGGGGMNCCQPSWCAPSMCGSSCCDGGSCSSGPLPVPGNFTPPPPSPMNMSYGWQQPVPYAMVPSYMPQGMMPQGVMPHGVQQTSYYPPYYPQYNPGYYYPPMPPAPMPNYWYGR